MNYILVFFISFCCILLELFWTKLLNLKAWNHVVYTVIPFAILGYGIGANIQLILNKKFSLEKSRKMLSWCLVGLSVFMVIGTFIIIPLPIKVEYLLKIFVSLQAVSMLLLAYTLFMIPFILIGFMIVHIFSMYPKETQRLYFIDLIGAAIGAGAFFYFLSHFEIVRSLLLLALLAFCIGLYFLLKRSKWVVTGLILLTGVIVIVRMPEPVNYAVDSVKGWEWIPGHFDKKDYDLVSAKWHGLGRTDIYRMKSPEVRKALYANASTFLLNVRPLPEFSYFSTNFLAGTPVYQYPDVSGNVLPKEIVLFTETIEAPYVLVDKPKVFIIGLGGGRDIFMAKTHGASEITGAEINSETYRSMTLGGPVYAYSGYVYDLAKTKNIDGRNLVKTSPKGYYDLIILNGVDTLSGLSSGAYAYAESYLYTKEALIDYLKILNDNGIIDFNRWLFNPPRETLRLQGIAFEALKAIGVKHPWENVLVLGQQGWSMTLVKKTAFTDQDVKKVIDYAHSHGMVLLYPSGRDVKIVNHNWMYFDLYAEYYKAGKTKEFEAQYPCDISVVTDDSPFFYKYYKFSFKDFFQPYAVHHTGPVIFWTQFLVLMQAVLFIALFIILPLALHRFKEAGKDFKKHLMPFAIFFACLGLGFMFIEIPFGQDWAV